MTECWPEVQSRVNDFEAVATPHSSSKERSAEAWQTRCLLDSEWSNQGSTGHDER